MPRLIHSGRTSVATLSGSVTIYHVQSINMWSVVYEGMISASLRIGGRIEEGYHMMGHFTNELRWDPS